MAKTSFRELSASPSPVSTVCLACEEAPIPDAPLPLCLYCIRRAFVFYLRHAEEDLSANAIEPPPEQDRRHGWVYFARFGDLIKIGWSRTPQRRMQQLQPDALLHIEPGTRQDEQRLHMAFAHLLVPERGREYFRAGRELVDFVNGLHCG